MVNKPPTPTPSPSPSPPLPRRRRSYTTLPPPPTDPFGMSLSAHLMLSTPLFRAVPLPLPWPEKPPSRRVAPRGEGAGVREACWSEKAEASESVISNLSEESAEGKVGEGRLETVTEVSSVDGRGG